MEEETYDYQCPLNSETQKECHYFQGYDERGRMMNGICKQPISEGQCVMQSGKYESNTIDN